MNAPSLNIHTNCQNHSAEVEIARRAALAACEAAEDTERYDHDVARASLQALPAGVVVIDEHGAVRLANRAAETMLQAPLQGALWREVIGACFKLVPGDDPDAVALVDGRRVTISTCPLGDRPGQILLLHDVTELSKLREQVKRQERLSTLGEVSASLAHQIRTPLSAALLYAAQVEDADERSDRTRFTAKLRRSLADIETLVRDMLLFVRGEVLGAKPILMQDLQARLRATLTPQVDGANARLCMEIADTPLSVLGNEDALLTVLQNLVMNSLEAGATEVVVSCQSAGTERNSQVMIGIVDNGPGIADSVQAHVFDPFFTTRANGTGLGLAVARNVIVAHGGHIEACNTQTPGCQILICLPQIVEEQVVGLQSRTPSVLREVTVQ